MPHYVLSVPIGENSMTYVQILTLNHSPHAHIGVEVTQRADLYTIYGVNEGERFGLAHHIRLEEEERLAHVLTGLVAGRVWSGWARLHLFEKHDEWVAALRKAADQALKNCKLT